MHLIFLIHGLFGNAGHLRSMEESIVNALAGSGDVAVHRAQCMSAVGTFDGVALNARKLLDELLEQVKKVGATHLSIVGYSMGGLCGRYLVGLLEEAGAFSRLSPVVFATFATPHLGSQYAHQSLFGKVFNFVGAHITGYAGLDLFMRTPLIGDMASRTSSYYRGLERFRNLYLFANTVHDRTVPFWTSYIAPKNPFSDARHLDLRLYSTEVHLVDMGNSRVVTKRVRNAHNTVPLRKMVLNLFLQLLIPFFLVLLSFAMCIISIMSWVRRWWAPDSYSHGESLVDKVGVALEDTLDIAGVNVTASQAVGSRTVYEEDATTDSHGLPSPGYSGLVDSTPQSLNLSPQMLGIIEALNELPWRKYAVRMTMMHTHGQIVDRRGRSPEGKTLLDFFARIMALRHAEITGTSSTAPAKQASAASSVSADDSTINTDVKTTSSPINTARATPTDTADDTATVQLRN